MEEYFQEAGRAGRDGLPAKAHVYYNSYDISKGKKKHLSQVMRYYMQKQKCKRERDDFGLLWLPSTNSKWSSTSML